MFLSSQLVTVEYFISFCACGTLLGLLRFSLNCHKPLVYIYPPEYPELSKIIDQIDLHRVYNTSN